MECRARGPGAPLETWFMLLLALGSVTAYSPDHVNMLNDCAGTRIHTSLSGTVTRYQRDRELSSPRGSDRVMSSREKCTTVIGLPNGWGQISFRILEFSASYRHDCLYISSYRMTQLKYCGSDNYGLENELHNTWGFHDLTIRYNISKDSDMDFKLVYNMFKESRDYGCDDDFECDNGRCIPDDIKCLDNDPCGDNSSCTGKLSPFEIICIVVGVTVALALCICCMKRTTKGDDMNSSDEADSSDDDPDQEVQGEMPMRPVHQSNPLPHNPTVSQHREDAQPLNGYSSYSSDYRPRSPNTIPELQEYGVYNVYNNREDSPTIPLSSHSPIGNRHTETGSGYNFSGSDVEQYGRPRSPGLSQIPQSSLQTDEGAPDRSINSQIPVDIVVHPSDSHLTVPSAPSVTVLGPNQHLNVFNAHANTQSCDPEFDLPPSYETVIADEDKYRVSKSNTDLNEIT